MRKPKRNLSVTAIGGVELPGGAIWLRRKPSRRLKKPIENCKRMSLEVPVDVWLRWKMTAAVLKMSMRDFALWALASHFQELEKAEAEALARRKGKGEAMKPKGVSLKKGGRHAAR